MTEFSTISAFDIAANLVLNFAACAAILLSVYGVQKFTDWLKKKK